MEKIINFLYNNPIFERVFHTSLYCLKRELKNCDSVLDLGCGPNSLIQYCQVPYSVGVDAYKPYLEESRKRKIHSKHILGNINKVKFPPASFDAVILLGVLEHLGKKEGTALIKKMALIAKKKVIVSCPNGFLPQSDTDSNPYQVHKSGWDAGEIKKFGYQVYGMTGLKILRSENVSESLDDSDALLSTIRYKPRFLWLIISELTQVVTYYFPKLSFEIFCVKKINHEKK